MNRHADLIEQYAQDWKETDTPWERWEYKLSDVTEWYETSTHPIWDDEYEYRRKLPANVINGVEVPTPYRVNENPVEGFVARFEVYPYVELSKGKWVAMYFRYQHKDFETFLNCNAVYRTEEDCEKYIEAMGLNKENSNG